jgi:hypothetical protein
MSIDFPNPNWSPSDPYPLVIPYEDDDEEDED